MKLLHRTRRPIVVYATLVLLLSIPAYYLILHRIWLADIDQDLEVVKRKVERGLQAEDLSGETLAAAIARINAIDAGVRLAVLPADSVVEERYRTVERYDALHGHVEPFRTYTSTIVLHGRPCVITVSRVIEETEELVKAIAIVTLVSLVLLFGGVLVLERAAARRIWAPFHRLLDALRRFQVDGAVPFRAAPTGIAEFDELERVLEQLTERNMAIYAEQRRFTENAAHELRTPLALLQAKLERLFQSEDLTRPQAELLEQADLLLRRMRRTHDGLLTLAQLDNAPLRAGVHCDPSAIVRTLLAQAQEPITDLSLAVEVRTAPNVQWPMEEAMAEILLGNLVGNAIRHTPRGGSLRIDLGPAGLTLANTGEGKALDTDRLFKRFSGSGKGLGLGLAIAQRVCERHGWALRYAYEADRHTFRVLPVAAD